MYPVSYTHLKIPYTFNKISVTEFFDDCAEDLQTELGAKNVEFYYSNYVETEVTVIADAEQIKRVVNNIVSNSLKYTDSDKPKKINLRVDVYKRQVPLPYLYICGQDGGRCTGTYCRD